MICGALKRHPSKTIVYCDSSLPITAMTMQLFLLTGRHKHRIATNTLMRYIGFMGVLFLCLIGCFSMIVWTPTVFECLICMRFLFLYCTCSAQLSVFHMEKRSRNTLIISIIIIEYNDNRIHIFTKLAQRLRTEFTVTSYLASGPE